MQLFNRFIFLLLIISISQDGYAQKFDFGTSSEEALEAYQLGWEQILDLGEWTQAEESFRRAVEIDPEFWLGWSQVGRISNDAKERMEIYQTLETKRKSLDGFELELMEVYLGSLKIIDYRDRGLEVQSKMITDFRDKLYFTSQSFLKVYPQEFHIEAEYIEAIKGKFGAVAALDSMTTRGISRKSPFFKSYQALCLSELGRIEEAMLALDELSDLLGSTENPAYWYTNGVVLYDQKKYLAAKIEIEKCLDLDPKHTLARRVHKQLEKALEN